MTPGSFLIWQIMFDFSFLDHSNKLNQLPIQFGCWNRWEAKWRWPWNRKSLETQVKQTQLGAGAVFNSLHMSSQTIMAASKVPYGLTHTRQSDFYEISFKLYGTEIALWDNPSCLNRNILFSIDGTADLKIYYLCTQSFHAVLSNSAI